eukprot:UN18819
MLGSYARCWLPAPRNCKTLHYDKFLDYLEDLKDGRTLNFKIEHRAKFWIPPGTKVKDR